MDGADLKKRRAKTLAGARAPQFVMVGDVAERIVARLRKRAAISGGMETAAHHDARPRGTKRREVKP